MDNVWALASVWVGLALVATLLAIWLKMSTALTEIVVGTVAQLAIGAIVGPKGLVEGKVELKERRSGARELVSLEAAIAKLGGKA